MIFLVLVQENGYFPERKMQDSVRSAMNYLLRHVQSVTLRQINVVPK